MDAWANLIAHIPARCLRLAQSYVILPNSAHRWCVAAVASAVAILIGCFVAYAFVEKHHLESNFFYGRVHFSFIDGGYPEVFGYFLELVSCAVFFLVAWWYGKKHWYMWAIILFVVFLDDAFKLHETVGRMVSAELSIAPAAGDLIGFASTGLLSAVFWFAGLRMIPDQQELCAYLVFTVYFSILIFFGVAVDAAHGLFGKNISQTIFTLIEDGGELLVVALISLSSLGMLLRQRHLVLETNVLIRAY